MTFYGIADVVNVHNNYEGGMWNVLSDEKGKSTIIWDNLTKETDMDYRALVITDDQKEIDKFVRGKMEVWAADANLYQSTLTQLHMLRADYKVRNKDYDDKLWSKLIADYYKAMQRHHGA